MWSNYSSFYGIIAPKFSMFHRELGQLASLVEQTKLGRCTSVEVLDNSLPYLEIINYIPVVDNRKTIHTELRHFAHALEFALIKTKLNGRDRCISKT